MRKIIYIGFLLIVLASCAKDDGTIIGTASADGGNIKSGITVKLFNDEAQLKRTTTTDNSGNFVFSSLDSENYYIAATVVSGVDTFDTGNTPQIVYVNDDIIKEVSLTLTKK